VLTFGAKDRVLTVKGTSTVQIIGLHLKATGSEDVLQIEDNSNVTVIASVIGPSKNKGIDMKDAASLELRSCKIVGNAKGGIKVKGGASYDIRHTLIVANGSDGSGIGGVELQGQGVFRFNTVADNMAQLLVGSGVRCNAFQEVESTIVWGNTGLQTGLSCATANRDNNIQQIGILGNLNQDPLFVSDSDYHLTWGSPCRDATVTLDPDDEIDYDRQPRPLGISADIGADEFVP
jgi:hypothetical protein